MISVMFPGKSDISDVPRIDRVISVMSPGQNDINDVPRPE